MSEIVSADFPGERLPVCLNPRLLQATEEILEVIAARSRRGSQPLRGRGAINRVVGRDANRKKMAKHCRIHVRDDDLHWSRQQG
ncbi:MAG: hypothetical protein OXH99_09050 [Bryobacterales bacterium]|nr:hypothetical protein [Bryobacterales bacterium]